MRKNIECLTCGIKMVDVHYKRLRCDTCACKENIKKSVIRNRQKRLKLGKKIKIITCLDCKIQIEASGRRQLRCKPCAVEYNRKRQRKGFILIRNKLSKRHFDILDLEDSEKSCGKVGNNLDCPKGKTCYVRLKDKCPSSLTLSRRKEELRLACVN